MCGPGEAERGGKREMRRVCVIGGRWSGETRQVATGVVRVDRGIEGSAAGRERAVGGLLAFFSRTEIQMERAPADVMVWMTENSRANSSRPACETQRELWRGSRGGERGTDDALRCDAPGKETRALRIGRAIKKRTTATESPEKGDCVYPGLGQRRAAELEMWQQPEGMGWSFRVARWERSQVQVQAWAAPTT
jgi:hypothetical protein